MRSCCSRSAVGAVYLLAAATDAARSPPPTLAAIERSVLHRGAGRAGRRPLLRDRDRGRHSSCRSTWSSTWSCGSSSRRCSRRGRPSGWPSSRFHETRRRAGALAALTARVGAHRPGRLGGAVLTVIAGHPPAGGLRSDTAQRQRPRARARPVSVGRDADVGADLLGVDPLPGRAGPLGPTRVHGRLHGADDRVAVWLGTAPSPSTATTSTRSVHRRSKDQRPAAMIMWAAAAGVRGPGPGAHSSTTAPPSDPSAILAPRRVRP